MSSNPCRGFIKPNRRNFIRKRPVSFGNPRTASYQGSVYTTTSQANSPSADSGDNRNHVETKFEGEISSGLPPLIQDAPYVQNMVAMVHVPPEQVPEGVLNLVRPHRPWIEHIRIVIESGPSSLLDGLQEVSEQEHVISEVSALVPSASAIESAASILAAEELAAAASLVSKHNSSGRVREPQQQRTYLVLFQLESEAAAQQMIQYLHRQPYTCLDETQVCNIYPVVAVRSNDEGISIMAPSFSIPPTKRDFSLCGDDVARVNSRAAVEDFHNCAVCLEHLQWGELVDSAPNFASSSDQRSASILTTVCNHSFHIDCLSQWQDSPCPVCRYDHSGLNGAVLSQCSQCDRTDHIMVCLICGVTSCSGNGPASSERRPTSMIESDSSDCGSRLLDSSNNGFPSHSCIASPSHARKHYNDTLHAYALDTETQHVWDFVGGGFVHRLLQNKDDGKLVEVSDPNNASTFERSQNPGLSDSQEGEVVHRKLEGYANQYYTLLKSQLEQQRLHYEERLEKIRREHEPAKQRKSSASTDLIAALKQERRQLAQQLERLQLRDGRLRDNVTFLKSMNESISANIAQLKEEIAKVQQERIELQHSFQSCLPVLEARVSQLMLQLEAEDDVSIQDCKPAAT